MLVLSRKVGESFVIGDKIVVTVVRIAGGGVRLGIEAPTDCVVVRQELDEPANGRVAPQPQHESRSTSDRNTK